MLPLEKPAIVAVARTGGLPLPPVGAPAVVERISTMTFGFTPRLALQNIVRSTRVSVPLLVAVIGFPSYCVLVKPVPLVLLSVVFTSGTFGPLDATVSCTSPGLAEISTLDPAPVEKSLK